MELKDIKTFVLHGIGHRVYTRGKIKHSSLDPKIYGLAKNVEHLNFEAIYDRNASQIEKILGANKKADAFLDIYDYYSDKKAVTEARALFRYKVEQARREGFKKIVVFAHSLGSLIGLTSSVEGESMLIDDFYCLGSPVAFSQTILPNYSVSSLVRKEVVENLHGLIINNLYFGYSRYDPVCDRYTKPIKDLLELVAQNIVAFESTTNHDFGFYIADLVLAYESNNFHTEFNNPNHRWYWFIPFLGSPVKRHAKTT